MAGGAAGGAAGGEEGGEEGGVAGGAAGGAAGGVAGSEAELARVPRRMRRVKGDTLEICYPGDMLRTTANTDNSAIQCRYSRDAFLVVTNIHKPHTTQLKLIMSLSLELDLYNFNSITPTP